MATIADTVTAIVDLHTVTVMVTVMAMAIATVAMVIAAGTITTIKTPCAAQPQVY